MSTRPPDTAADLWSRYEAALARMDGTARLRVALELSDGVREIRLAGIHARHPDLDRRAAVARMVAEDHGVTLPWPG